MREVLGSLVDLERLLQIRGADFDAGFVRGRVAEMMGEGDERIAEWDRIVRETRGPGRRPPDDVSGRSESGSGLRRGPRSGKSGQGPPRG